MLRLTFTGGGADVVQQVHDEVHVHLLVIEAVVVEFEQLLLLSTHVGTLSLQQSGLVRAAPLPQRTEAGQGSHTHTHTNEQGSHAW